MPSEISHFKLLYGSDNNDRFEEEIRDWETMFDMLRLSEEERERIFYGNAARLFGVIPVEDAGYVAPEPDRSATGACRAPPTTTSTGVPRSPVGAADDQVVRGRVARAQCATR